MYYVLFIEQEHQIQSLYLCVICRVGAPSRIWLLFEVLLYVFSVCANLNTAYLFTAKLKHEEYDLTARTHLLEADNLDPLTTIL